MSGKIVTVDFRNDTLFAVERDDGVYVALKPICDSVGLKWHGQFERVSRDAILSEGIRMIRMPSVGGMQEALCLRLDLVNGWLFTIDESRVRDDETRQKVLAYKRECYGVLFSHFYGKATGTQSRPLGDEVEMSGSEKLRQITEARHIFGLPAAAELWFKLGMPVTPAMLKDPRQYAFDYNAIRVPDTSSDAA